MSRSAVEIQVAGESVVIDSEKVLVWPAGSAIFLADTHFGKDASGRKLGLALPEGSTQTDLARLNAVILQYRPGQLWILGDVFHSRDAQESRTVELLRAWRELNSAVEVQMVPGNHDLRALHLADSIGIRVKPDGFPLGPWRLTHAPSEDPGGYTICGHIHPGVQLAGKARQRLVLPCFVAGLRRMILPAFGSMTGKVRVSPADGESVWSVAEGQIFGPHGLRNPNEPNDARRGAEPQRKS